MIMGHSRRIPPGLTQDHGQGTGDARARYGNPWTRSSTACSTKAGPRCCSTSTKRDSACPPAPASALKRAPIRPRSKPGLSGHQRLGQQRSRRGLPADPGQGRTGLPVHRSSEPDLEQDLRRHRLPASSRHGQPCHRPLARPWWRSSARQTQGEEAAGIKGSVWWLERTGAATRTGRSQFRGWPEQKTRARRRLNSVARSGRRVEPPYDRRLCLLRSRRPDPWRPGTGRHMAGS
jgi:hypothetical protein